MKHLINYILLSFLALPLFAEKNNAPQRETELPMQCTMPEEHDLDIQLFLSGILDDNINHVDIRDEAIEMLDALPDSCIYIYGHTDVKSDHANYNQKLSDKMAQFFAEMLKKELKNQKNIKVIGVSTNYPLIPDDNGEYNHDWVGRIEIRLKELK